MEPKMTDDHQLRIECAQHFTRLDTVVDNLRSDVLEMKRDQKEILAKVDTNRDAILKGLDRVGNEISALKIQARGWGAVGGLFAALITIVIAVAAWAFG